MPDEMQPIDAARLIGGVVSGGIAVGIRPRAGQLQIGIDGVEHRPDHIFGGHDRGIDRLRPHGLFAHAVLGHQRVRADVFAGRFIVRRIVLDQVLIIEHLAAGLGVVLFCLGRGEDFENKPHNAPILDFHVLMSLRQRIIIRES